MLAAVVEEFAADTDMRDRPVLDRIVAWIVCNDHETVLGHAMLDDQALVEMVSRENTTELQVFRVALERVFGHSFRAERELRRHLPFDLHDGRRQ